MLECILTAQAIIPVLLVRSVLYQFANPYLKPASPYLGKPARALQESLMLSAKRLVSVFSLLAALATPALALEYPIGVPQQRAGMEIAAVYLQPVEMEPDGMMRKAARPSMVVWASRPGVAIRACCKSGGWRSGASCRTSSRT